MKSPPYQASSKVWHQLGGGREKYPYSRRNPQCNRENLILSLKRKEFSIFMGTELSVNRNDPSLFTHGRIDFDKLITTDYFQNGINIVIDHIKRLNISLLCAEKDPYRCHRFVLVAYELTQRGIEVKHIREDGRLESQHQLEEKLLQEFEPGYDQEIYSIRPNPHSSFT